METKAKTTITVESTVKAPVEKVWKFWTEPAHIIQWNSASPDWHTPTATNDVRTGGKFTSRMEARDGSMGFDFGGTYSDVKPNRHIAYTMDDDRKVSIDFSNAGNETKIVQSFEAEDTNSIDMQRGGWQAIMDNFKSYTEAN